MKRSLHHLLDHPFKHSHTGHHEELLLRGGAGGYERPIGMATKCLSKYFSAAQTFY